MSKRSVMRMDEQAFREYSAKRERFGNASEIVETIPTLTDIVPPPEGVGTVGAFPNPQEPRYLATMHALCDAEGIPRPYPEYRFYALRKWRFDFAWPDSRAALEVDGGVWSQGRHTRGDGFLKDQEKRNAAVLQGWRVIHCTPQTLAMGVSHIATILTRAA